jgi:hypothetical protein
MRKLIAILLGAAVVGMTGSAVAQTTAPSTMKEVKEEKATAKKETRWKAMDVNSDGMISKDEFMKYQESLWGKLKRNAAGLVTMADIEAAYAPGTVPSAIPGQPPEKAKP